MGTRGTSEDDLGGVLAVVKPNPLSILIGCVPGIILVWSLLGSIGADVLLLFHPEIPANPGVRPFIVVSLILTAAVLGLGLRHIFDRAELCQGGFRFLGKSYRYDQIGPISWGHHANSGMTRFFDTTTLTFRYQGRQVRLRTRYLQDLSYAYYRVYETDPTAGNSGAISRAACTDSKFHPR